MPGAGGGSQLAEDAKRKAVAAANRKQMLDALDLMGAMLGRQIYDPAKETLVIRYGVWVERGDCTAADVIAAAESLTTPEALAKIKGQWDLNAAFAEAVGTCRNRRLERERLKQEEAERKRWEDNETIRNRAKVLKLLSGIGTQVGKGRPTTPREPRVEDQEAGEQNADQAAGQEATGPERAEEVGQEEAGRQAEG